jgi:RNA-binding protein
MPAPTNPKKKSLMPSTPLRRALRGHGHALDPIVQIGHQGTTPALVKQVTQALADHELIKVKLGSECPQSRFEVAERLGEEPGVEVAQILGKTILLYKRHPHEPRFEGERARARAAGEPEPRPAKRRAPGAGKRRAARASGKRAEGRGAGRAPGKRPAGKRGGAGGRRG